MYINVYEYVNFIRLCRSYEFNLFQHHALTFPKVGWTGQVRLESLSTSFLVGHHHVTIAMAQGRVELNGSQSLPALKGFTRNQSSHPQKKICLVVLNQPIWKKICARQIGSSSPGKRLKFKKYLSYHHQFEKYWYKKTLPESLHVLQLKEWYPARIPSSLRCFHSLLVSGTV